MEVIKCIRLEKEFAGRRGWQKAQPRFSGFVSTSQRSG